MRHGRLDMLFEEWPVALWIDRERDEISEKNDDALSTE